MKTNNEPLPLKFYQNLGELFYAVAFADKTIKPQELNALKDSVQNHWKQLEDTTDEFGVDAAYQIEFVFDWLDYQSIQAEESFNNFSVFYKENPLLFNTKIKALIKQTAHNITQAFAGKNKNEVILLTKLNLLFDE